jgi:hypothetical protein
LKLNIHEAAPPKGEIMSDQWKAKVKTIAGRPVAVVDVTITRTILVDADAYEHIGHLLSSANGDPDVSGLKEVADFYELASQLPPESRRFVIVPWTDAESKKIGLRSFAEILNFFEHRAYWRVEGNAEQGFRGYLNFGGQDRVIDLSESAIPQFKDLLQQTIQEGATAKAAGTITKDQQDAIDNVCSAAGKDSVACESMYKAFGDMLREKDRQKRMQQEKDLHNKEKDQNGKGEFTGDFPGGFGGGMGGAC